jgi:hypothetical protein
VLGSRVQRTEKNLRVGGRSRPDERSESSDFDADILRKKQPCAAQGGARPSTNSKAGKESCMKLNSAQVERALTQFEAQALPDNHPVVPQLSSMFGEHTFFLDSGGLNVVEPTEPAGSEEAAGMIVNLAYWSDETLTKLSPHEPEPTGVVVNLESRH